MSRYDRVITLTIYYMLIEREDLANRLWTAPGDKIIPRYIWRDKANKYNRNYQTALQIMELALDG